jgi:hypothetical protein
MTDDPTITEGDPGFLGMASRLNPVNLPPGLCQLVENMRLDRGVAQTRRGAKRLGDDIDVGNPPIVLPFALLSPVIENFYTGGIFASGVFSSPNYNNSEEYIILCGRSAAFLWQQDTPSVSVLYPTSEIIEDTDSVSCIQAFNEFFIFREADSSLPGWEWQYTTGSGITVSGTTATANITAHGYLAGMRVRIEEGATPAFAGHEFDIASVPNANSFTFTVPSGTATDAAAGIAVRRVKAPLVWSGTGNFTRVPAGVPSAGASFLSLPSVPWAAYIQNRLWIPSGRDTVLLSDILDSNTYDPFFQNFRANQGSVDYLVGIHPWTEGQALVFMRNSIWLATLKEGYDSVNNILDYDTAISRLTLLTDEIGCTARRTIVTAGNYVFFLSDSGVYRLDTKLDIKLRGDTLPLSDPIADQLEEINSNFAYKAVAKWWNNRLFIAVPIGKDFSSNNTIFIWNALNNQWESRDFYSINLDELLISTYSSQRRLFAASRSGTLFLLDEMEQGDDVPTKNADAYTSVEGYLLTRRYGWGSLNAKRLLRAKASLLLPPDGACEIHAVTTDFDNSFTIATLTNDQEDTEDYTLKAPLRCKATYLDLEFTTSAERPTLRQISAEATRSNFDPTETRTLN